MDAKSNLRRSVAAVQWSDEQSHSLICRVDPLVRNLGVRDVGVYQALPGEVSLAAWFDRAQQYVRLYSPKVLDTEEMAFYGFRHMEDLAAGRFGILEPQQTPETLPSGTATAVLVPGVAFDRHGMRLGRGKGFYDRFLSGFEGIRIGICPSSRLVEEVPAEAHDVAMDYVVTENFVLRPLGRRRRVI